MTDPDSYTNRPGSAAAARRYGSPAPPSPRPSVASRASRSSLQREREQQDRRDSLSHPQSHSQSPQTHAPIDEDANTTQPAPDHQLPTDVEHDRALQPHFTPLFALVNPSTHSSQRQKIHHPTVHYIFEDDDPEILTAALAHHHRQGYEQDADYAGGSPYPMERAILLDMVPSDDGTGLKVSQANSLSPDWAVVSTSLTRMESGAASEGHDGGENNGSGHAGPWMLKIDGVAWDPVSTGMGTAGKTPTPEELQSSGSGTPLQPSSGGYTSLAQDFEKRMNLLRRVGEAGAQRQRMAGMEEGHAAFRPLDEAYPQ